MPTERSTEQPASKVSADDEPVSVTAKEQNNAAKDSTASQKGPEGAKASGNSSATVEPVKGDDTAAKARQRQERFKALQARAVGFSISFFLFLLPLFLSIFQVIPFPKLTLI